MQYLKKIIPPSKWKLPVAVVLGIFVGLGLYVIKISNAPSYLSDAPETCINCHVMESQYASWTHSSHRENATCNDCHVPHENMVKKYYFKGQDGLRHSTIFTLRAEPQVIMIKEAGAEVVQNNCKRCHSHLLSELRLNCSDCHDPTEKEIKNATKFGKSYMHTDEKQCWDCHREVPHGRVNSLSATPNALVPKLNSPVPEWLDKMINKE